jgi:hypothetical protein
MASDSEALLIFKMRGMSSERSEPQPGQIMEYKEELPQVEEEKAKPPEQKPRAPEKPERRPSPISAEAARASIYYNEGGSYPDPMKYYKEAVKEGSGKVEEVQQARPMGRANSKAMARGRYCTAHPFRNAYAICSYCHRPFCFEDIMEYQKDYYCIEDLDRITAEHSEKLSYEYSTSSLITSFILIGSFLVFVYFANGQLGYIFGYIASSPLLFLGNINLVYVIGLISLAVMIVGLAAAIYILLGSRQGHIAAATISMVAVLFFASQYVGTGTPYFAVVAVLQFAAFLFAVNSASSGALIYDKVYEDWNEYGLAYGYGARF